MLSRARHQLSTVRGGHPKLQSHQKKHESARSMAINLQEGRLFMAGAETGDRASPCLTLFDGPHACRETSFSPPRLCPRMTAKAPGVWNWGLQRNVSEQANFCKDCGSTEQWSPPLIHPHVLFTLSCPLSTWLERNAVCTVVSQDLSPPALPWSLPASWCLQPPGLPFTHRPLWLHLVLLSWL